METQQNALAPKESLFKYIIVSLFLCAPLLPYLTLFLLTIVGDMFPDSFVALIPFFLLMLGLFILVANLLRYVGGMSISVKIITYGVIILLDIAGIYFFPLLRNL